MRRWVFSLYPSPTLLRLSPFCRGPPAHPASSRVLRSHRLHPALLRASRSRFPSVRQFGTEPQPRLEPEPRPNAGLKPDLRCTQPSTGLSSFLAALRSRTRAFPPPSLPFAAEHGPFLLPRCPPQPSAGPSLLPLVPPPSPRAGHKKTPARCRAGVGFTENRKNYFSFFSAFSIAAFRAAKPAISPRVVFSTEALIFFTVDFVASAAARFSAFSAAISAFLASE